MYNRNFLLIFFLAFVTSAGLAGCNIFHKEKPSPAAHKVDTITSATKAQMHPCQITERFTYEALHFDPLKQKYGRLSYRLSRDAWVRVQVILRKDPNLLIRTIIDWTNQKSGTHTLFWDGRDSSGYLIDKSKHPCMIKIEADKEIHRTHNWSRCNPLKIKLKLPKKVRVQEDTKVRIPFAIAPSRSGYIDENGFTARLYIDFEMVLERVFPPSAGYKYVMNLHFNSKIYGIHLITLVVSDGADHAGSASRLVRFLGER